MKAEEQFYEFIMARTKPERQEEMKHLLIEMMDKKNTGHLDKMYLMGVVPRALSYLNPDDVNEVKKVVSDFASKL